MGPKWLFLADFDSILPYIKVKGFSDISGSILNIPPYVYGHNFWTDAPNLKIQGILKTRDPVSYTHLRAHETLRYLVCRLLLEKKKWKKWFIPLPIALHYFI